MVDQSCTRPSDQNVHRRTSRTRAMSTLRNVYGPSKAEGDVSTPRQAGLPGRWTEGPYRAPLRVSLGCVFAPSTSVFSGRYHRNHQTGLRRRENANLNDGVGQKRTVSRRKKAGLSDIPTEQRKHPTKLDEHQIRHRRGECGRPVADYTFAKELPLARRTRKGTDHAVE